ncbi:MAG: nickel-dependent lactate racemase [Anaerotruncus sp.]|nr:nickel-dependent lactate racemase [Anaerotruncus sp.]
MEPVRLKYGETQIELGMEGAKSVQLLTDCQIEPITDLKQAFLQAVEQECIQSPPLSELICAEDLVTIVISDLTRFWMRQDKICALLVDYLHEVAGVAYTQIAIVVALGTHRPQSEAELQKLVSPEVYAKVQVCNHDCMAPDLAYVGTTSYGTEVWVHPLAVGRKVILVSGTVHHLMAGFGGGRKSILPGISGKKTICQNHIHSLSPQQPCSNPMIGMGKLAENPVNEDMNEAANLVAPVFGINLVVNSQNEHCRLLCGHWKAAWEESCAVVEQVMGVPIQHKADIVVVSCGGYPKDINLYQGVKALLNAAQAVRDGGELVFLAECREGGGAPEFFDWIAPLRRGTLDADLRANFSIAGYIFYASCEVIARCKAVFMLTQIPHEQVAPMKLRAYDTIEQLLQQVDFTGKDVYVMPYGGYTVPILAE